MAMTDEREKDMRRLVDFIFHELEEMDCSCSYDEWGRCWYHMGDKEQIDYLTARCLEWRDRESN